MHTVKEVHQCWKEAINWAKSRPDFDPGDEANACSLKDEAFVCLYPPMPAHRLVTITRWRNGRLHQRLYLLNDLSQASLNRLAFLLYGRWWYEHAILCTDGTIGWQTESP